MSKTKHKTIVIFEGLSSSGKSTTIKVLENLLAMNNYNFIRYSRAHPLDLDILYNDFDKIIIDDKQWLNTSFRISRFGIRLNDFLKSKKWDLAIFDRGPLTIYLEAITLGIPKKVILPFIENLNNELSKFNYLTLFMNADLNLANLRVAERVEEEIIDERMNKKLAKRARKQAKMKRKRNERHIEYYDEIESLDFLGTIKYLDSNKSQYERSTDALKFIENSLKSRNS